MLITKNLATCKNGTYYWYCTTGTEDSKGPCIQYVQRDRGGGRCSSLFGGLTYLMPMARVGGISANFMRTFFVQGQYVVNDSFDMIQCLFNIHLHTLSLVDMAGQKRFSKITWGCKSKLVLQKSIEFKVLAKRDALLLFGNEFEKTQQRTSKADPTLFQFQFSLWRFQFSSVFLKLNWNLHKLKWN